jgi:hypothetical protein
MLVIGEAAGTATTSGLAPTATPAKILDRIVWKLRVQRRVDRLRAARHDHRIAVRRRFRNQLHADDRIGAGPVIDDDRLAEVPGQGNPIVRDTMSFPPPGANGEIRRIGRTG